jgi:osmotically-inducible protein OsmY
MLLSMKTIRVLLAVALGLGCSLVASHSYAQGAIVAPSPSTTPQSSTFGSAAPTFGTGTQMPQSMSSQGASPTGTNQATSLKQGTGKQPTLIGSATTVSVLGSNVNPTTLGFIGADAATNDYYSSGSLASQGGVGGGTNGRATSRGSTANRGSTGAGAARQNRAQSQQRNNTTGGANGQQLKTSVRAALRSEISIRPQSVVAYTTQFQNRMTRLPALQRFNDHVEVSVSGRTATLRGSVGSKREADMLAKLALMEAGISSVDNQLVVLSASADSR